MLKVDKTELFRIMRDGVYRPWQVLWDVTYACQLRCSHCYQMNLDWKRKDELSTERFIETLDELELLGAQHITFSGGDPFVRRDFLDIVAHAGTKGFQVVIYSSGAAITDQVAVRLRDAHVSWVELTLMGADQATHDEVTRRPGSWDKLMRSIAALRRADVQVVGKTVVTTKNVEQIPELLQLCAHLGIEYKFDPHMWRPWDGSEAQIAHLKLDREGLKKFYKAYRPPTPQDRTCAMGVSMCNAGRGRVGITPRGGVNPCTTYGDAMEIGNLHTQSITEIWLNSPALKEYRAQVSESYPTCHNCEMSAFCDWCPGMSGWAGKPLEEPYEELCEDTDIKKSLWEEREGRKWIPLAVVNGEPIVLP